jgi:cysteine-rich repeat protein
MRIRRSTLTLETGGATTTTTTTTIANASTTTTTLPSPGRCGDGVVDPGEVCDGDVTCTSPGGSFLDCSACGSFTSGSCTPPGLCGNGVRDPGEECDDDNAADCDGCSARCTVERFGNGVVDCDEECDDGNTVDGDGCDSSGTSVRQRRDRRQMRVCDGGRRRTTCAGGIVTCAADCRSVDRPMCPPDSLAPAEVCSNCIDDDLDGLIDYEDPSCCSGPALDGAILKKLRLKARRRNHRVNSRQSGSARPCRSARDQIVRRPAPGGCPPVRPVRGCGRSAASSASASQAPRRARRSTSCACALPSADGCD